MGDDPPDDPGGFVPSVGLNVVVSNNDTSAMDTEDGGLNEGCKKQRKRVRISRKICRHCNKKRKDVKGGSSSSLHLCQCTLDENSSINNVTSDLGQLHNNDLLTNSLSNSKPQASTLPTTKPAPPRSFTLRKYERNDAGPYIVHVMKQSVPEDRSVLHPVQFGNFLKKNAFKNIVNGSLKRIGRNKLSLAFVDFNDANNFIDHPYLENQNFKAFIPTFSITRMGLVRGVPANWSEDEILDNVSVPIGCGNIIKVRRIKRKKIENGVTEFVSTETVVFTFDGQVLPKRVYMCYTALTVDLYTYPTVQCFQCCRFGHTKAFCRSKPRCFRCGESHAGDSCSIEEDSASCCLCSGLHFATSKSCPEFDRQKQIKTSMAQNCISYSEASKQFPPISKSFADVLKSKPKQPMFPNNPKDLPTTPSTSSYRKTVFLKPRSPPRQTGSYDHVTHFNLTKEYNMTSLMSNGTALKPNNNSAEPSITEIIHALIGYLSKSNLIPSNIVPSNDAPLTVNTCIDKSIINNGSSNNSVEL